METPQEPVEAPETLDTQATPEAPIETPEGVAESTPQQEAWERQFPGGPSEIYRALQETKGTLTREQQQRADYERQLAEYQAWQQEQFQDPFSALPPTMDEHELNRIAEWAKKDPARAAQWAYENHDRVGPEVAGQLMQFWAQQDYWAARRFELDQYLGATREQIRQEMMGEIQPLRDETNQRMSALTLDLASQEIPNWESYWMPRVVEFLEQPENSVYLNALNGAGANTRQAADQLYNIYAILHAREQRARGAAAPSHQAAPAPSAQTETQSTSDAPARDEQGRFTGGPRKGRLDHITGVDD